MYQLQNTNSWEPDPLYLKTKFIKQNFVDDLVNDYYSYFCDLIRLLELQPLSNFRHLSGQTADTLRIICFRIRQPNTHTFLKIICTKN